MKKLFTFILCFLLVFSVVRVANNKGSLTLKGFVNTLSTFEFDVSEFTEALENVTVFAEVNQPEPFPNIAVNFSNIESMSDFFTALGNMFKDIYRRNGYESRLLSRTTEDAVTVTSVLIPWNTCGMTQATILGVATLTYLPYCFFNLISPLMSIFVAWTGYKIHRKKVE